MNKREFTKTVFALIGGTIPLSSYAKTLVPQSAVKETKLEKYQLRLLNEITKTQAGTGKIIYVPRAYGTTFSLANYAKENPNTLIVTQSIRQRNKFDLPNIVAVKTGPYAYTIAREIESDNDILNIIKSKQFDTIIFDGFKNPFAFYNSIWSKIEITETGVRKTLKSTEIGKLKVIYIHPVDKFLYNAHVNSDHEDLFVPFNVSLTSNTVQYSHRVRRLKAIAAMKDLHKKYPQFLTDLSIGNIGTFDSFKRSLNSPNARPYWF